MAAINLLSLTSATTKVSPSQSSSDQNQSDFEQALNNAGTGQIDYGQNSSQAMTASVSAPPTTSPPPNLDPSPPATNAGSGGEAANTGSNIQSQKPDLHSNQPGNDSSSTVQSPATQAVVTTNSTSSTDSASASNSTTGKGKSKSATSAASTTPPLAAATPVSPAIPSVANVSLQSVALAVAFAPVTPASCPAPAPVIKNDASVVSTSTAPVMPLTIATLPTSSSASASTSNGSQGESANVGQSANNAGVQILDLQHAASGPNSTKGISFQFASTGVGPTLTAAQVSANLTNPAGSATANTNMAAQSQPAATAPAVLNQVPNPAVSAMVAPQVVMPNPANAQPVTNPTKASQSTSSTVAASPTVSQAPTITAPATPVMPAQTTPTSTAVAPLTSENPVPVVVTNVNQAANANQSEANQPQTSQTAVKTSQASSTASLTGTGTDNKPVAPAIDPTTVVSNPSVATQAVVSVANDQNQPASTDKVASKPAPADATQPGDKPVVSTQTVSAQSSGSQSSGNQSSGTPTNSDGGEQSSNNSNKAGSKSNDVKAASLDATSAQAPTTSSADTTTVAPTTALQQGTLDTATRMSAVRQVADRLQVMAATKPENAVTVQLTPQGLGTVEITVKGIGKAISAEFAASNEGVKAALSDNRAALTQTLEQKGYTVSEFTVHNHVAAAQAGSGTNLNSQTNQNKQDQPQQSSNNSQTASSQQQQGQNQASQNQSSRQLRFASNLDGETTDLVAGVALSSSALDLSI